jgi:vanillate O-demethylase monooxygenase subunit
MFLKNVWYVCAQPEEVNRTPLARTICNERIVFWRTEAGTPVAFEDRCCHRRMPLSKAVCVGDRLRCYYHGLEFEPDGRCSNVPGQSTVPPGSAVRAYPVTERYKWMWIWMGDPALADEDKITPYPWRESEAWGDKGTYFHVLCGSQLIVDNLLDLSHLAFVHQSTLGNAAVAENADSRVFRDDNSVTVARWTVGQNPPPTYQKAGGFAPDQKVDRWQIIEYRPPGFVRLFTGAAPGAAQGKEFGWRELDHETPEGGIGLRNLNAVTPETETTCHYFWSQCQDVQPRSAEFTDALYGATHTAFHQDWEVFELQQANWDYEPVVDINVDAGPIAARQLIDCMIAEENQATATAAMDLKEAGRAVAR